MNLIINVYDYFRERWQYVKTNYFLVYTEQLKIGYETFVNNYAYKNRNSFYNI